jgi:hypothetical protein
MKTDGELRKLALALIRLPDEEMERRFYEIAPDLSEKEQERLLKGIHDLDRLYASIRRERGRVVDEEIGVEFEPPGDDPSLPWTGRCLACGCEWPMEPIFGGEKTKFPPGFHLCPKGCNRDKSSEV